MTREDEQLYVLEKPGTKGVVYYPAADAGIAGWAVDPVHACHYRSREQAEEAIKRIGATGGVHTRGFRAVPDPLPLAERHRIAAGRLRRAVREG